MLIFRFLSASIYLLIWVLFVTPVWLFLIVREVVGYSFRAVIQTMREGTIPDLKDLDAVAGLYPNGYVRVLDILFGRSLSVQPSYPKPGFFRLFFDTTATIVLALIIFDPSILRWILETGQAVYAFIDEIANPPSSP